MSPVTFPRPMRSLETPLSEHHTRRLRASTPHSETASTILLHRHNEARRRMDRQQTSLAAVAPAPLLFTDDARGIVAWLDAAGRFLNPDSRLGLRPSLTRLHALFQALPPPPPSLQERWAATVWPQLQEPFTVYLVRCLAHHIAITGLVPHIAVDAAPSGTAAPHEGETTLSSEVCRVVALRTRPYHADMAQTGWEPLPCPHCHTISAEAQPWQWRMLPWRYGGDICVGCGQTLPRAPVWTRRRFLVVERQGGVRAAAVGLGDDLGAELRLGQQVRILCYPTVTANEQPLLVIHAATPLSGPHMLYGPSQAATRLNASFPHLCWSLCPSLLGQDEGKGLLLLSAVHTLYRCLRAAGRPRARWRPLHLLLLGPTKGGKTTLLHGIARVYGSHAEMVAGTIIQRGGPRRCGAFADTLPSQADGLLLGGAAATSVALLLDDIAAGALQATLVPLRQLLSHGTVPLTNATAAAAGMTPLSDGLPFYSSGVVGCTAQLVASAHEESGAAAALVQDFPLVARVSPRLSLAHTATIGHAVVAASVARSSLSRSPSAAGSAARSRSTSQQSGSDGNCYGTQPSSQGITSTDILSVIAQAPDPEALERHAGSGACTRYFTEQLTQHMGLLEAAARRPHPQLPPPAAARGASSTAGGWEAPTRDVLTQPRLMKHRGVLAALTQARLIVASACPPPPPPLDSMLAEVWALYAHHLRSVAQQLDHEERGASTAWVLPPSANPTGDLSAMLIASSAAAPSCYTSPTSHGKRKRSKKAARLYLVDLMYREQRQHRQQQDTAAGSDAVCPFSRAEALYLSIGGSAALGEPFEMVMAQMQQDGLLIRRPTGWHISAL